MSVPSIGPITALAFIAAIEDPHRFKRTRDIGVYLGLTEKRYQSGETDIGMGISKRAMRWRGIISMRPPTCWLPQLERAPAYATGA
jgi:transposase